MANLDEVRGLWTGTYESTAEVCLHGASCEAGMKCSVRLSAEPEQAQVHILTSLGRIRAHHPPASAHEPLLGDVAASTCSWHAAVRLVVLSQAGKLQSV